MTSDDTSGSARLLVRDLMTTGVFAVLPDDNLVTLRQLMRGWRVRHAPVVDEDNVLLGVVTERDLLRRTQLGNPTASEEDVMASLRSLRVQDVITANVEVARPDEGLAAAARRMFDGKLGCLPVIDAGFHLVGILTESDFVRRAAEDLEQGYATCPGDAERKAPRIR